MKPVEIIWEDSQSCDSGWLMKDDDALEEWAASGPLTIRTVGLLMRKTKQTLVVVQCDSEGQVLHGVKIPRCCVKKVRRLK